MKRIKLIDKYSTSIWKKEEVKFVVLEKQVRIPNEKLKDVDLVLIEKSEDIEKIPSKGGCYWIWTNEPVHHLLHKNRIPKNIGKGEIIYNGIAKENVQQRIARHLLAAEHNSWSAMSLDIYRYSSKSHRKKAMSPSGKVPYIFILDEKEGGRLKHIRTKDLLHKLFLSPEEKSYINKHNSKIYYFRNGINIFEDKHNEFKF